MTRAETAASPHGSVRFEVAVRRPDDGRVLRLRDRSLPAFTVDSPPAWPVVSVVVEGVRANHGLDVAVLRAVAVDDGPPGGVGRRVYEAEHIAGAVPAGASWVDAGELGKPLASAIHPAHGDRHPWYRPGWLAELSSWTDARLHEVGIHRRGPIRQVRSWGRAAVLTLDTDHGRLWVKSVPDVFSHEIAVTELLADIDPGIVPPVVAADRALGRIITEHVDGPTLDAMRAEPAVWAAALSRLAEAQRVLAADTAALSVAGVEAAPLTRLADALPAVLADDDLLLVGRPGGLSRAEATSLRGRVPELVAACRTLDGDGIPDSLEHGDLRADEVILGEMGPVILDWSDGSVTHPFLSAASLLADVAPGVGTDDLGAAYLGPWVAADLVPAPDGRGSLDVARTVLPLHLAMLYAERILPALEQPWEMERVVPEALRAILRR